MHYEDVNRNTISPTGILFQDGFIRRYALSFHLNEDLMDKKYLRTPVRRARHQIIIG